MYKIPKINNKLKLNINISPWEYPIPKTYVELSYDDEHLYVDFTSYEWPITCNRKNYNNDVCNDSCVEIFINPYPNLSDKYLNFEFNAFGVMLLEFGKDRYNRTMFLKSQVQDIKINSSLTSNFSAPWNVNITIPFAFFKDVYDENVLSKGDRIKLNCYKCGNETKSPHFSALSHINSLKPDFHLSEFFVDAVLD